MWFGPGKRRMPDDCRGGDPASINDFEAFLRSWMVRQEHLLGELLSAQQNLDQVSGSYLDDLVKRVLDHYRQYYDEKSRAARRDIFRILSPTWFTPLELSLLWIGGLSPGTVFGLVEASVAEDLTEEQHQRMQRLKEETKSGERDLGEELAKVQESMGAPPSLDMARRAGWGGITGVDVALEPLKLAMEALAARADWLRRSTVERAVGIMTPAQNVRFLAAGTLLQVRIREWGLRKDAERRGAGSDDDGY